MNNFNAVRDRSLGVIWTWTGIVLAAVVGWYLWMVAVGLVAEAVGDFAAAAQRWVLEEF